MSLVKVLPAGAQANEITKFGVTAVGIDKGEGTTTDRGSASGTFILNSTKGTICSTINNKMQHAVFGAHIHKGPMGARDVISPPVVTLDTKKFKNVFEKRH